METGLLPMIDDHNIPPPHVEETDNNVEDSTPIPNSDFQQPVFMPMVDKQTDFLSDMSKTNIIMLFVVFILGFFMGKTMQPVIIRPT